MMGNTKKCLLMAMAAAALLVTGCATGTGPQYEVIEDPNAPVTEVPGEFGAGSTWVVNRTVDGEAETVTGTLVEIKEYKGRKVHVISDSVPNRDPGGACDGANGYLFDPSNDNFIACLKDGELLGSVTPHEGRYAWPLQVGKTWKSDYQWTDYVLHPEWSGPSWQEFTVLAWEEVTVPAGTFMAYKVARTKGAWDTAREEKYISWYAPELEVTIKVVWSRSEKNGYGPVEGSWELVSLDRK